MLTYDHMILQYPIEDYVTEINDKLHLGSLEVLKTDAGLNYLQTNAFQLIISTASAPLQVWCKHRWIHRAIDNDIPPEDVRAMIDWPTGIPKTFIHNRKNEDHMLSLAVCWSIWYQFENLMNNEREAVLSLVIDRVVERRIRSMRKTGKLIGRSFVLWSASAQSTVENFYDWAKEAKAQND